MQKLKELLAAFLREEDGQDSIEAALVACLIALAAGAVVPGAADIVATNLDGVKVACGMAVVYLAVTFARRRMGW